MLYPILSLDLPDSIPVLNSLGSNWQNFMALFKQEICARGIWSHFDGSAERPCGPGAETMKNLWEKSERNARYLLSERLCDSLCLKTWKLETIAARWEFLEKMYGKLANVSGEVLPPRRAEEVEKMSPKSKNQSDEGTTYLEKELATVAESSGPEDARVAIAYDKADVFVEEAGDGYAVIFDNCDFVGGGLFEMLDEDPDYEGVWSCDVPLDYKAISEGRISNNNVPFFDHSSLPCPFSVPEIDSPAEVV